MTKRPSIGNGQISLWLSVCLAAAAIGCGDNLPFDPPIDAAPIDAPPFMDCGDGLITGLEECDDGNTSEDDECLNNCTLACGDGVVNSSEICDIGIAAGMPGACPTDCNDGDACTADVLSGDNCQSTCVFTPITAPTNGDGCCPPGQDANTDDDCTSICGNSAVEGGETCDTAIPAGMPGSCPQLADCVDGAACTTDELDFPGTCSAACRNDDIVTPMNGDGCCPPGADLSNDNDCAMCGDGLVTPGTETCDTAIPIGMPGACPEAADCPDMDVCTTDVLTGDMTCQALCTNTPITDPDDMVSDGCCPPMGNANNDIDCVPVCGNNVIEMGEQCDDGNTDAGDGCDDTCQLEPTAFRIETLELRDPHPFATAIIILCADITGELNDELENAITMDTDGDGFLDFNVVNLFRPLSQMAPTSPLDLIFAECVPPVGMTSCDLPVGQTPISSTATNMAMGTCLAPEMGTTSGYNPAITNATGPCYASLPEDLSINLGGILIPLTDAQIGATYVGAPATSLINGLLKGFISEADAQAIVIPADIPVIGGFNLASLLPGGMGNCNAGDDRDIGPDGVTMGWWMYFNFTASEVPWTGP